MLNMSNARLSCYVRFLRIEQGGGSEIKMDLEHEKRLADVENRASSNTKRIDRLEETTAVLNRLATAIEVMATKQDTLGESVDKLTVKVDSLEAEPAKKWHFVVEKSIYFVVGAILAYVFSQVGL